MTGRQAMVDLRCSNLLAAYRAGTMRPADMLEMLLPIIDAYRDPAVWISRVPAKDLFARAAALQADPASRELPLYGVPFAVKDNIDVAGMATTAGCPDYAYMPQADATSVGKLLAAGAILIGKTNLDQFATGLVGTRSPYGAPRCVFDDAYISGGSSSGSAVAVAGGLVSFALGTDTAGSGRIPAGFNNLIGLKPSKGKISTSGVVPACRTLDCVSIFALDAADADLVLRVAEGFDATDPWSRAMPQMPLPAQGLRFGVLRPGDREFHGDEAAASLYQTAVATLTGLDATAVEFDYAPFKAAGALLYDGPFIAERRAALGDFFDTHFDSIDPPVRTLIRGADAYHAADAFSGLYQLQALRRAAESQMQKFDVMLLPTSPTIYTIGEIAEQPIERNSTLGLYTSFVNLIDCAAVSLPGGFRPNGLPAGVSLVGPAGSDHALTQIAARLHHALGAGGGKYRVPPAPASAVQAPATDEISIAVAGAHLSGMPLNHQLTGLGGRLVKAARTAKDYRLFALAETTPPKPGLVRSPGHAGCGIEIEIWSLPAEGYGRFVAALPPPMAIGTVVLEDGTRVSGFTCEACAIAGATDITAYGGWRAYRAAIA